MFHVEREERWHSAYANSLQQLLPLKISADKRRGDNYVEIVGYGICFSTHDVYVLSPTRVTTVFLHR
jgi:hypothetical protein